MSRRRYVPRDRADSIEELVSDLRYAFRGLRRTPGFAGGVVLTLGLGIGANAAMFGIVDRLLLRAPAYLAEPSAVHRVYFTQMSSGKEHTESATSYRRYLDLTHSTSSFSIVAAVLPFHVAVGTDDSRERPVQLVTSSFWRLFNATPITGRFFRNDDDALPSGSAVAVLSYDYWRTNYASRLDVTGERIRIGTRDFTIVGVAPSGFVGTALDVPVAYIPFAPGADETDGTPSSDLATGYGWAWLEVIAQRRSGISVASANADLTRAFQLSYASNRETTPSLAPASIAHLRAFAGPLLHDRGPLESDDARIATWLLGVTATVLLIACANVGNLLLARAFGRRREIAIRLTLGAGRGRLFRQLLIESALLAALGGTLGLAIAQGGGHILRATLLPDAAWTGAVADPRVLLFAAIATLFAALLSGLAPMLSVGRRTDVTAALKSGVRDGTWHRSRTRTALLVAQIALSVVLLAGAGLFVLSVHNERALDLGFDAPHISYVRLELRGEPLSPGEDLLLRERLLARARELPGVAGAARTLNVPFLRMMTKQLFVEGIDSVSRLGQFDLQAVSSGYFEAMGTRILAGRPIAADDGADAPQVIVVSQSMAHALWPGKNALGHCVRILNTRGACRMVVGVAEDIRGRSLRDDRGLTYYLSLEQFGRTGGGLFVRSRSDGALAAEQIRRELQPLMPGASYVTVTPFAEVLEPSVRSFEVGATMFTIFGTLALVVAAIGLYSVVACGVAHRTYELGVRVALGADAARVVRLVLGESLLVATVAAAIGIAGALIAGRRVAPLLFETSPSDPRVLAGVPIVLVMIAAAASLVPALRAARVDPSVALRAD